MRNYGQSIFFVFLLYVIGFVSSVSLPATARDTLVDSAFSDKWALVIGVDSFKEKSWNYLDGECDAYNFRNYLLNCAHFKKGHVKVLAGSSVTKSNLQKVCSEWLHQHSKVGDLAVVYFRTRGILIDENPDISSVMALYDTNVGDEERTGLKTSDLPLLFSKGKRAGPFVLILDADFSGSWNVSMHDYIDSKWITNDLFILVNSTNTNQISWHSLNQKSSVFTRELIDRLVADGSDACIVRAALSINEIVAHQVLQMRNRSQNVGTAVFSHCKFGDVNLAAPTKKRSNERYINNKSSTTITRY